MKKFSTQIAFIFLLFCSFNKSFSQLSDGGTPAGFKLANDNRLVAEIMPPFNIDSMFTDDSINQLYKDRPYRFGYNHLVNYNINNSGRIVALANGDRIWQLDVKSPGALSINLAFSNFHLPIGARLFVYSKDHSQILGAFTSKNNYQDKYFGTELIYDDEVVVEYDEPVTVAGQGTFTLFRVTHGYKSAYNIAKAFGQAGNCINNVNCPQYSAWSNQKRAVVCLVSGGNEFCSGSLVNNTRNDGTPYILTANHCGTADGTWVFRFNWEAPGCPNPSSNPSSQSISGGTPVANRAGSDFDLCLMSSVPPSNFNVFYAGWDHSGTPATNVTGIHHPSGDIKKLSQANNAVTAATYNGAQTWHIGQWTDGVTEPGSSGSPLFDQNKRIIGQLYGGSSACGVPTNQLNDDYGRFDISWNTGTTPNTRLHDWLDPDNTGAVTNDGYDPNISTFALDAAVSSVVSPTGSSCNTNFSPVISIRNAGSTTLTTLIISYHLDSNSDSTYNWSGTLTTANTANVTLSNLNATVGSHTLHVVISNPNGGTDQNASNDTTNGTFTIINVTSVAMLFSEGFTSSTFPPTGWTINNPNTDNTWTRSTTVGGFGTSNNSAKEDESAPFTSTAGEVDDLVTPYINMTTGTSPAYVSFDVAYARYNSQYFDSLVVLASSDCGETWSRIYAKGGTSLATAPDVANTFVPTSSQWRKDSINVSSYLGQPAVRFTFEHISGWGNATYLDNININASASQSLDAGLNNLSSPANHVCTSSIAPSYTLLNSGQTTLSSVTIYYKLDNGSLQSYVWSGTLSTSQSTIITLPAQNVSTGSHTLTIFSSAPNGGTDGNNSNDTIAKNFTVGVTPIVNLGADTTQCGGTISLNAQNSGASYLWSTNATAQQISVSQSGNYFVTVTNNYCTASGSVNVTINSLPTVSLQLPSDTFCTSAGLVALSGGNPAGGIYSGVDVNAGQFNASSSGQGIFPVTYSYTDGNSCTNSSSENLVVQICSSIDNLGEIKLANVFPNPFKESFTIQFEINELTSVSIDLFSVDGRLVKSILNNEQMSAGVHSLNVNCNDLSSAIYFLKLNNRYLKMERLE